MSRLYKFILFCGLLPLCVGVGVFLLWLVTRQDLLVLAGLVTCVAGCVLVSIGGLCLIVDVCREWKLGRIPRKRLLLRSLLAGGVLLVNFPAAAFVFDAAFHFDSRCEVSISNQGSAALTDVALKGGGVHEVIGEIPVGDTVVRRFWVGTDGALSMSAKQGQNKLAHTVEAYVTNGLGFRSLVIVEDNGRIEVRRE